MKLIKNYLLIILVASILGLGFNTISFFCPNRFIHKNVLESAATFQREGAFPASIPTYDLTILDNNSDAWMLLMADYESNDRNILEKAVGGYYKIYSDNNSLIGWASLSSITDPVREVEKSYARYWHGWMLPLKILLMFFSYDDIRFIGIILQYALVLCLFLLMQKRNILKFGLSFFVTLIILCPIATCISFEYTFIFYIFSVSSIFILLFHEKFQSRCMYPYVFLVIGISTSYFDFLTYPVVALAIPLCFFVILTNNKQDNWFRIPLRLIGYSVSWGVGYLGFWSMKWIISSGILKQNIIMNAINDISFRTGNVGSSGESISYLNVLKKNLKPLAHETIVIFFLCIAIFVLIWNLIIIRKKIKINFFSLLPYIIIGTYPFIWFFLTKNHSYIHEHFAYRELAISVFSFGCAGISLFDDEYLVKESNVADK